MAARAAAPQQLLSSPRKCTRLCIGWITTSSSVTGILLFTTYWSAEGILPLFSTGSMPAAVVMSGIALTSSSLASAF